MGNVSFESFQYKHLKNLQVHSPFACLNNFSRSGSGTRQVMQMIYLILDMSEIWSNIYILVFQ